MSSYGSESWGSRKLPLWLRVSRDASGRPSRDASRRSTPQITKPVGPVIAMGVLTVARFVGKVGCYLLVASLSGRLRQGVPLGTPHGVPPSRLQSRRVPSLRRGCSRWRDLLGKSDVTSWSRVSRDASGRPSRDASRRFHPPDHKTGGSRHCDGGAHGGEICPSREVDDPLAS